MAGRRSFLLEKRAKERAVAGGVGTGMWEISAVVCLFPLSLWTLRALLRTGAAGRGGASAGAFLRRAFLGYAGVVVPIVSAFTPRGPFARPGPLSRRREVAVSSESQRRRVALLCLPSSNFGWVPLNQFQVCLNFRGWEKRR